MTQQAQGFSMLAVTLFEQRRLGHDCHASFLDPYPRRIKAEHPVVRSITRVTRWDPSVNSDPTGC